MRTLSIERVNNGWIVRPFHTCPGWASATVEDIFIYRTVAELQADLPRLLAADGPLYTTSIVPAADSTAAAPPQLGTVSC